MDLEKQEALVRGLTFPPRPDVVVALTEEAASEHPNLARISKVVKADVALAGAMLRAVNSPVWGRGRNITSINQAVDLLGLRNVKSIATGLVLRKSVGAPKGPSMERFWDSAEKVALIAALIAGGQRGLAADEAYTYGLFHDCGIPMLLNRFPGYKNALVKANQNEEMSFTANEEKGIGTHHAVVGYFLARSWGLSQPLSQAILRHHEFNVLRCKDLPDASLDLIAVGHIAQHIHHMMARDSRDLEWERFGTAAMARFGLSNDDFLDLIEASQATARAA